MEGFNSDQGSWRGFHLGMTIAEDGTISCIANYAAHHPEYRLFCAWTP